mmetsp:Transcript_168732/g.542249  ORF Transcript_168732/g.542249 Transcript_168732/m.542249 type:complete len:861 (+) Transcript_168732:93-2675(+)
MAVEVAFGAEAGHDEELHTALSDFEKKLGEIYNVRLAKLTHKVSKLEGQVFMLKAESSSLKYQLARAKQLATEDSLKMLASEFDLGPNTTNGDENYDSEVPATAPPSAGTVGGPKLAAGQPAKPSGDRDGGAAPQSSASLQSWASADSEAQVVVRMASDGSREGPSSPSAAAAFGAAAMCARRRRFNTQGPTLLQRVCVTSKDLVETDSVEAPVEASRSLCDLLPFWTEMRALGLGSVPSRRHMGNANTTRHRMKRGASQRFRDLLTTSNPISKHRLFWETIGAIIIVSDFISIPLQAFTWDIISDDIVALPIMVAKASYWTVDIPLTFFVGFYVNGVLELSCGKTAKNYLSSWLLMDLCLVVLDWTLVGFQMDASAALMSIRALRMLRLLRFVRLVRLWKLNSIFRKLVASIKSEYALILLDVSEILVVMIMACHLMACAFYALGMLAYSEDEEGWINFYFKEGDTVGYRYATALHWAITQFTPASMEVTGKNTLERVHNIIVIIIGVVAFSTFVSSVTQAMTQLRKLAGSKKAQFTQLRRYLGEHRISMPLATRVYRYYEQGSQAKQHRMMWRDVALFADIPDILQMDLLQEVYAPVLAKHPFFLHLQDVGAAAVRALCHHAVREVTYRAEQDVFHAGQLANKVSFVVEGALEFSESVESFAARDVLPGQWLSEAALWVKWYHTGTAVAKEFSLLCMLSGPGLQQVLPEHVEVLEHCCTYAERFVQYLHSVGVGMSDLIEDHQMLEELARFAFKGDLEAQEDVKRQGTLHSGRVGNPFRRAFSLLSRKSRKQPVVQSGSSLWQPGSRAGSRYAGSSDELGSEASGHAGPFPAITDASGLTANEQPHASAGASAESLRA